MWDALLVVGQIDIAVYTPCIHGEVILASEARRKMDLGSL